MSEEISTENSASGPSSSEAEEYEVEKVLSHRWINGKIQYLLKWVGLSEFDKSWEYEENIMCADLIADYIRSNISATYHANNKDICFKPFEKGSNITITEGKNYFGHIVYFGVDDAGNKGILTSEEAKKDFPQELLTFLESTINKNAVY